MSTSVKRGDEQRRYRARLRGENVPLLRPWAISRPKRALLHSGDGETHLVPLAGGRGQAVVDSEFASVVGLFNWCGLIDPKTGTRYAFTSYRLGGAQSSAVASSACVVFVG